MPQENDLTTKDGQDRPPYPAPSQVYQAPNVILLGKAVDLVQQDIEGQLRDGTGGWYVWGS